MYTSRYIMRAYLPLGSCSSSLTLLQVYLYTHSIHTHYPVLSHLVEAVRTCRVSEHHSANKWTDEIMNAFIYFVGDAEERVWVGRTPWYSG